MPSAGREAEPSNTALSPSTTTTSSPATAASGTSSNVAVTLVAAAIVTEQGPLPTQPAPLQPVNVEAGSAIADSVTCSPFANGAPQAPGQLMPSGRLTTLPVPVPEEVTLSVSSRRVLVTVQTTSAPAVTGTDSVRPSATVATVSPLPSPSLQAIAVA